MIRRFEYTDEKSNKFWEIECDGLSHTVRYGTIGSHGRTKTTEFDSGEAASNDAERLIGQKTERGYIETSSIGCVRPRSTSAMRR